MISVYKLKPKFQQMLMPVLKVLNRIGITANQITLFSILFSFGIAVCFWYADEFNYLFLALPIGLLLRMALNALDGMMARIYNQQSKLGEVLNEAGDIISDVMIFLPLVKYENNVKIVVAFIVLSILNELAGIAAKFIGGERRYDGPMGKSDRALLIGVYGLFAFFSGSFLPFVFLIAIGLLVLSTFLRIKRSIK